MKVSTICLEPTTTPEMYSVAVSVVVVATLLETTAFVLDAELTLTPFVPSPEKVKVVFAFPEVSTADTVIAVPTPALVEGEAVN